jgi:hypothetical protein
MAHPSPGPDMRRLAEQFVESMRELGWELDYSEQSVQTIEDMIERQFSDWRPWRRGKATRKNMPVASLVGAYIGEVMVRNLSGEWGWMPEFAVAAVRLPSGTWTSPPAKAQKRFADGQGDDLVAYYEAMKTV